MADAGNRTGGEVSSRLAGFGTTIFAEMSALAVSTGSINLGQGFPDTDGPAEVMEGAIAAIRAGHNQYPPGLGIPELRQAVAEHQRRFYRLSWDPDTEVLVTAGATEAIAATMLALLDAGDEVIAFEPFYDSYAASISMAGAVRVPVTLRTPTGGRPGEPDREGFRADPDALRAAVTPRTKMILVNSPHNPTGAVFDAAELQAIADVAVEHDLLVVTDEVYEHLVFDGRHVPLATLPGMRERTISISSAGKTFSVTGWKVGWVTAPAPLVKAVLTAKQFLTYANGTPFQHAVAAGLRLPDAYFTSIAASLRHKRDLLSAGLTAAGLTVFPSHGTYFVTADVRSIGEHDGMAFCRSLPERCGVVAVPSVVFYDDVAAGSPLVRFAFCKRDEVLSEAVRRLSSLTSG